MKKEATPKRKGLKNKRPPIKKEATPKCKGLKHKRPSMKNEGAKNKNKSHECDLINQKSGTVSSPKPGLLN
jgi:hypothetical protein